MPKEFEQCPICSKNIESQFMENHHYIPKSKGGKTENIFRLCGTCHDVTHLYIDINDIEKYKTPESLLTNPLIDLYVKWIKQTNHTGHWNVKQTLMSMAS